MFRTRVRSLSASPDGYAAGGGDVRLGGGPSTVRRFLEEDRFSLATVPTSNDLTHQFWNRQTTA